jgi:hypothetical protein
MSTNITLAHREAFEALASPGKQPPAAARNGAAEAQGGGS